MSHLIQNLMFVLLAYTVAVQLHHPLPSRVLGVANIPNLHVWDLDDNDGLDHMEHCGADVASQSSGELNIDIGT